MAVIELPEMNIETPDLSNIDLSKVELPRVDLDSARESMGRAVANMGKATSKARSNVRDAMVDRLPRQSAPSPLPFVFAGLVAGISIGLFLATSPIVAPRLRDAMERLKSQMGQRSTPNTLDELGQRTEAGFETLQDEAQHARSDAEQQQETYAI